jgi:hypothetical protein
MTGEDVNTCCHSNLVRAEVGEGLEESDVLNVFMCTRFTRNANQYFYIAKPSPVEEGDYIEFLAEIDPAGQRLDVPPGRRERCLRRPGRRAGLLPPDRGDIQTQGRVGRARR